MAHRPWSTEELAELAAMPPRKPGALMAFAERWKRNKGTVSAKLMALRIAGKAKDCEPCPQPPFPVHRFD